MYTIVDGKLSYPLNMHLSIEDLPEQIQMIESAWIDNSIENIYEAIHPGGSFVENSQTGLINQNMLTLL